MALDMDGKAFSLQSQRVTDAKRDAKRMRKAADEAFREYEQLDDRAKEYEKHAETEVQIFDALVQANYALLQKRDIGEGTEGTN